MCPLAARKEIFAGLDIHLLFTIYDLLVTIIIFTDNRRFFINEVYLNRREQLWIKGPEETFLK